MGSVPRSPSHSERRAGQPRLPPSPGHLGSGGCLDTRAGGRGDLCLPEDGGRSHCPLRTPWAVGGAWVPASLGLNCQLQSASASQSVRQCGPGSRLPAGPPQGSEPSASLLRRGAVGGALLGWGNRPGPRSSCQTAQVSFERLHTTGLSFRLQFQEKAPTQAENGPRFTL